MLTKGECLKIISYAVSTVHPRGPCQETLPVVTPSIYSIWPTIAQGEYLHSRFPTFKLRRKHNEVIIELIIEPDRSTFLPTLLNSATLDIPTDQFSHFFLLLFHLLFLAIQDRGMLTFQRRLISNQRLKTPTPRKREFSSL